MRIIKIFLTIIIIFSLNDEAFEQELLPIPKEKIGIPLSAEMERVIVNRDWCQDDYNIVKTRYTKLKGTIYRYDQFIGDYAEYINIMKQIDPKSEQIEKVQITMTEDNKFVVTQYSKKLKEWHRYFNQVVDSNNFNNYESLLQKQIITDDSWRTIKTNKLITYNICN